MTLSRGCFVWSLINLILINLILIRKILINLILIRKILINLILINLILIRKILINLILILRLFSHMVLVRGWLLGILNHKVLSRRGKSAIQNKKYDKFFTG